MAFVVGTVRPVVVPTVAGNREAAVLVSTNVLSREATPSRDVRRAFARSASRLLPVVGDLFSQTVGLFETCSETYAGLEERYLSLRVWPWDGQVSLLLMGWVLGPGFRNEGFQKAACRYVPDFAEMSLCELPHRGHTGVISLGGMVRAGFAASAKVLELGKNRKRLYWFS